MSPFLNRYQYSGIQAIKNAEKKEEGISSYYVKESFRNYIWKADGYSSRFQSVYVWMKAYEINPYVKLRWRWTWEVIVRFFVL